MTPTENSQRLSLARNSRELYHDSSRVRVYRGPGLCGFFRHYQWAVHMQSRPTARALPHSKPSLQRFFRKRDVIRLLALGSILSRERGSPIATARRLAFDEEDSALGIVGRFLEGIVNGVGWGHLILQAGFHPRISHLSTPLGELVPNEHGEHGHWFQMNTINMDIGSRTPLTIAS